MAKKDWDEVKLILEKSSRGYLKQFNNSSASFLPNQEQSNPITGSTFSICAKDLKKSKPASWIPLYKKSDLSDYFLQHEVIPIRCGQAQFFFIKAMFFLIYYH